jgi:hypothetical protein
MTLKRDNLVFPPKISKPLGREKIFRLQVGREEKSLGTYALYDMRINKLKACDKYYDIKTYNRFRPISIRQKNPVLRTILILAFKYF